MNNSALDLVRNTLIESSADAILLSYLPHVRKVCGFSGSNGALDPADFQRTVEVLLSSGADPVITEDPGKAAWTHEITDKALN